MRDRDRRALLIGLIVVGPVLAYRFAVGPYLDGVGEVGARIEVERDLLARELDVIRQQPAYPERARRASEAFRAWEPKLFGGTDVLAASSALTNYLVAAATASRVLIQSSEVLDPDESSSIVSLRVSLSGESDLQGVTEFLGRLEDGGRLLHVEELTVRQARGADDADRFQDELLSFDAVVRAFALGGSDDAGFAGFATIGGMRP